MKRFFIFFTIGIVALIFACSKENNLQTSENDNQKQFGEIKIVELSDGSKTTVTMLEFTSIEHYENTITALEKQMEDHDVEFLTQYDLADFDGDKLDSIEEEVGFVEHQPLIDFENYYNIPATMRQVYVEQEAEWLNNEELDIKRDPALKYCFSVAEMTLLNPNGEVKIGDKILKLTDRGFAEISNMDVATLIRIDNGDSTALNEPTVNTNIETNGGGKGDCSGWKGKSVEDKYNSSRKVIKHVHFHSYPWKGTSEAQITSYKKNNGKWKQHRMNLGVNNHTNYRDKNCNPAGQESTGWRRKKDKSISRRATKSGAFPSYKAENGLSVYGYFEYAGASNNLILTW